MMLHSVTWYKCSWCKNTFYWKSIV